MVKHEEIVSRKATQREKAEFKNLKDYVLKQKKFGELQDTKSTEAGWLRN